MTTQKGTRMKALNTQSGVHEQRIELLVGSMANVLVCPSCGSENLHQTEVEVFFRDAEDSKGGRYTYCSGTQAVALAEADMAENPSSRRDGLRIYFSCENCNGAPKLTISQHKGYTYMAVSYLKEVS